MEDKEFRRRVWQYAVEPRGNEVLLRCLIGEHNRRLNDRTRKNYADSLEACYIRSLLHPEKEPNLADFYKGLIARFGIGK